MPEIPKEIVEAERQKRMALDEVLTRIDDLTRKEGRGRTPEEGMEIVNATEADVRDELWRLRAFAEESGRIPERDFETLRFMVKERRLAARANEDVEIFLDERDEIRADAHRVLAQYLELIGAIEAVEAEMAKKKGEEIPRRVQSARRQWLKKEMDYWHYAGAA